LLRHLDQLGVAVLPLRVLGDDAVHAREARVAGEHRSLGLGEALDVVGEEARGGAHAERFEVARVDGQRGGEVLVGLGDVHLAQRHHRAGDVRRDELRVHLERGGEVLLGVLEVVGLRDLQARHQHVRTRAVRVALERFLRAL
jgi:hypothetical protein